MRQKDGSELGKRNRQRGIGELVMKNGKIGNQLLETAFEGERSESKCAVSKNHSEPEVLPMAKRRKFSAKYKLRILDEAEKAAENYELASLLRREGLYYSYITKWKKQKEKGALKGLSSKKRGRKTEHSDSKQTNEIRRLKRENARLKNDLRKAEIIIDVQKKISNLLGIEQSENESTD